MPDDCVETHQLAGLDDRARGFTRAVEVRRVGDGYRAVFRYEARSISADIGESERAALLALVRQLQTEGFTQLRSQLSFRGTDYLGNREPWIEYPDPKPSRVRGILARWFGWTGSGRRP